MRQIGDDQIARDPFLLVQQIDRDHPHAADEPFRRADAHCEIEEAHRPHQLAIALRRPQADARFLVKATQPLDIALPGLRREGIHPGVGPRPDIDQPFQARIVDREGANDAVVPGRGAHARFLSCIIATSGGAWGRIPEGKRRGIAPKDSSPGRKGAGFTGRVAKVPCGQPIARSWAQATPHQQRREVVQERRAMIVSPFARRGGRSRRRRNRAPRPPRSPTDAASARFAPSGRRVGWCAPGALSAWYRRWR